MNSFYTKNELQNIGFKSFGENILISRKASIYSPERIRLGNNIRIDDFCILSGDIVIKDYVHIAAYSALYGGDAGILICDYSNISSRVCIYALSDDYSGRTMTNPMIPDKYKIITSEKVVVGEDVIIGSGSTVLPGVVLSQGTAIGAMSLVKKSTNPWTIYAGIPIKEIKPRSKALLGKKTIFEKELVENCYEQE